MLNFNSSGKIFLISLCCSSSLFAIPPNQTKDSRTFDSSNATGEVYATHPWGKQKIVPAESCKVVLYSYYLPWDNSPNVMKNAHMSLMIPNNYGYASVDIDLPWEMVPPQSPFPDSYHGQQFNTKIDIDKNTIALEETVRLFGVEQEFITKTLATIDMSADGLTVSKMTYAVQQFNSINGVPQGQPIVSTFAECRGPFQLTVEHNGQRKRAEG